VTAAAAAARTAVFGKLYKAARCHAIRFPFHINVYHLACSAQTAALSVLCSLAAAEKFRCVVFDRKE
jgi:hypothetical protein